MSELEVKAGKKRVVGALVGALVVLAAFGAAFVLLGGADLVADLFGGKAAEQGLQKPATPLEPSTAAGQKSAEPSMSTELPSGAEETGAGTTEREAGTAGGSTSGDTVDPAITPPTSDQAARMYWEQVASQEQIGKLVRGDVKSFAIGTVSESGGTATVPLSVRYVDGSSLTGRMVLRKYGNAWYFSSIARTGNPLTVTTGKSADLAVVSTIVNQQASNQDLVSGIVSGEYRTCVVNGVVPGSGTATIRITLSGGSASPVAGRIACISKVIDGTKMWFITSFTKN